MSGLRSFADLRGLLHRVGEAREQFEALVLDRPLNEEWSRHLDAMVAAEEEIAARIAEHETAEASQ